MTAGRHTATAGGAGTSAGKISGAIEATGAMAARYFEATKEIAMIEGRNFATTDLIGVVSGKIMPSVRTAGAGQTMGVLKIITSDTTTEVVARKVIDDNFYFYSEANIKAAV
jgi:hypothetical protein